MKNIFVTNNAKQTQELGELLAKELKGNEIICLTGELGSGKTTFAQGILRGLGAKGPYTSPTFLIMKHYKKEFPISKSQYPNKSEIQNPNIKNIYHVDAYRVGVKDILELGWREIIAGKNNVVIVEWAEKIRRIVPKGAVWIRLGHKGKEKREIVFESKS